MRIVLISTDREPTPPIYGGAIGTWVFEFAKELARRGHDVVVIGKVNTEINYGSYGIRFVTLPSTRPRDTFIFGGFRVLWNSTALLIKRNLILDADIIQAHYFTTSAMLPLTLNKRKRNRKLVFVWHNTPKVNVVNRFIARRYDLCIAVSKFIAHRLIKDLGILPHRTAVIYDFIDTDKHKPSPRIRHVYRDKLGLEKNDIAILYVGRIIPQKGVHHLILAFRFLARIYDNVKLIIVGPSGEFDIPKEEYTLMLKKFIYKYRLQNKVLWMGNVVRKVLLGIYNAADIVVIPTMMEEGGILLVTLEAMAYGKPIVAYNIGALAEAIEHEKVGILVRRGDVLGLIRALRMLLEDDNLRRRMEINAMSVCREKFDVKVVVRKALLLYEKLLRW